MDEQLQAAIEVIPEGESITFDAWKLALNTSGKTHLIRHWLKWKRAGLIEFPIVRNEQGLPVLMVSRAVAGV